MKGYFKPRNPQKYKGDPTNIIYRSSWELRFMSYLDSHPDVVQWSSEEFCIPYRSPMDNRVHRYYPDFKVKKRNSDGSFETMVVEIKPLHQSIPPERGNKTKKRYFNEVMTYGINDAKWRAATQYCEERKWKFMVMTEKELGIK
jgi:hypothetical protein